MNQQQVEVVCAQLLQNVIATFNGLVEALLAWLELAGDVELFPVDANLGDGFAYLCLVSIVRCGVNMAIPQFKRLFGPFETILASKLVCSIAEQGYAPTCMKHHARYLNELIHFNYGCRKISNIPNDKWLNTSASTAQKVSANKMTITGYNPNST